MDNKITLTKAKQMLDSKECSAKELVQTFIDCATKKKNLNCFITETFDNALNAAQEADQRIANGNALPLDGLPIANKDLYCTKDVCTTAGSKILKNFVLKKSLITVSDGQTLNLDFELVIDEGDGLSYDNIISLEIDNELIRLIIIEF